MCLNLLTSSLLRNSDHQMIIALAPLHKFFLSLYIVSVPNLPNNHYKVGIACNLALIKNYQCVDSE